MSAQNHKLTAVFTDGMLAQLKTAAAKVIAAEGQVTDKLAHVDQLMVAVARVIAEWFEACPEGTSANLFAPLAADKLAEVGITRTPGTVRTRILAAGIVANRLPTRAVGKLGTEGLFVFKSLTADQTRDAVAHALAAMAAGENQTAACAAAYVAAGGKTKKKDPPKKKTLAAVKKTLAAECIAGGRKSDHRRTAAQLALVYGTDPSRFVTLVSSLVDDLTGGEHRSLAVVSKVVGDTIALTLADAAAKKETPKKETATV